MLPYSAQYIAAISKLLCQSIMRNSCECIEVLVARSRRQQGWWWYNVDLYHPLIGCGGDSGDDYPLMLAIKYRRTGCVKTLLELGVDPNHRYEYVDYEEGGSDLDDIYEPEVWWYTYKHPLIEAVTSPDPSYRIVHLLLSWGADPNVTSFTADDQPTTPIQIADSKGRDDIVRLLRSYMVPTHHVTTPSPPPSCYRHCHHHSRHRQWLYDVDITGDIGRNA